VIQEAMDTCPVDCIAWVSYQNLAHLERNRPRQVIRNLGIVQTRQV
jgi:ferredoxin